METVFWTKNVTLASGDQGSPLDAETIMLAASVVLAANPDSTGRSRVSLATSNGKSATEPEADEETAAAAIAVADVVSAALLKSSAGMRSARVSFDATDSLPCCTLAWLLRAVAAASARAGGDDDDDDDASDAMAGDAAVDAVGDATFE